MYCSFFISANLHCENKAMQNTDPPKLWNYQLEVKIKY